MSEELISILVPVYNVRDWLTCCLESISAQTWENWEAILVDDGSTDGSGDICNNFAEKDSRFRVIHQRNSGVSVSRNVALAAARGKYIYFADADDCIHPRALECLHSAICSGPYRMASADYVKVFNHDGWDLEMHVSEYSTLVLYGKDGILKCVDRGINAEDGGIIWLVVWNKLMERSLLLDITFEHIAQEDVLFMFRVYSELGQFIHIRWPLYAYLERPRSLSTESYYLGVQSDVILNDCLLHYASGNEEYEALILKKSFRRYLTARYHAKGRAGKKRIRVAFRPFFNEHGKEYLSNGDIPFSEKALSAALYLCPWAVWAYMKMTNN